jgi:hypothetical protein
MLDEIVLSYADFKVIADRKKFFWQMLETPSQYLIWGYDLPAKYSTRIYRTNPCIGGFDYATEQANAEDFEANYKADCNRPNTISPTAAQTQFFGKTIELAAEDAEGYCEWSFDTTTYISKVMPMPIDAQKGDTLSFEVWTKPGVMGPDPIKVGQYGFDIPVRGTGGMGWVYGSGGGEIKSYCTVRCYYRKLAGTGARDFNVMAEFLV